MKAIKLAIILFLLVLAGNVLALSELTADSSTTFLAHYNSTATADFASGTATPSTNTGTSIVVGKIGNGILIDSADRLRYSSLSNNINRTTGTMEFWTSPTWNGADTTTRNFFHYFFNSGASFRIDKHTVGGSQNISSYTGVTSSPSGYVDSIIDSWNANEWHHIAVSWGALGRKFYIDGVLVDSDPNTQAIAANTPSYFYVGSKEDWSDQANAVFDEFRISNIQRNDNEIAISAGILTDTEPPTITITWPTTETYYSSLSNPNASGTAADNVGINSITWSNAQTSATGAATSSNNWADWSTANFSLAAGNNTITITATDTTGNTASDIVTMVYDNTDPNITITIPTSASTYITNTSSFAIGGTATDNFSIESVNWARSCGNCFYAPATLSNPNSPSTNWNATVTGLIPGNNTIIVVAWDSAGRQKNDTLTVTYDTTPPTLYILQPTNQPTYVTTLPDVNLSGSANDDSGITSVTWVNDRGGNGTATGTTSWNAKNIALTPGINRLTVTATDGAGVTATDLLQVTYNAPDLNAPTISIVNPTSNDTYSITTNTVTISGTSTDNVGVTQVTWSNSRGGSGTATLTPSTGAWTKTGITLYLGSNILTVTAKDASNNTATDTLTITYALPCTDADADGYGTTICGLGYDCNDNNSMINPSRTEICGNGINEDCNATTRDICPLDLSVGEVKCEKNDNNALIDCAQLEMNDTLTQVFTQCISPKTAQQFEYYMFSNVEFLTPTQSFAETGQVKQTIDGIDYYVSAQSEGGGFSQLINEFGAYSLQVFCRDSEGNKSTTKTISWELSTAPVCDDIELNGNCTQITECQSQDPDCFDIIPNTCNNDGVCDAGEDSTCYNDCGPSTPTGASANVEGQKIIVSWNNNPEADVVNYVINYGKSNSFGSAEIVTTTSHEFIGLETGETYYFQVIAVDATGMQSSPSETVNATINNVIVSPNECDASQDQICDEDCGAGEDPDCEIPDNNTNTDNNTVQGGFDFNFENLDMGQVLVSLIFAAASVVLAVKYKTILANKK